MKKKMFQCVLCCAAGCAVAAAPLEEGLIFHVPFEEGASAVRTGGTGRCESEPEIVPGRVGKGAVVSDKPLLYNNTGNIDLAAGTVAFWVKPDQAGNAASENWSLFRAVHLAIVYTKHSKALFFMSGATRPEKGFGWNYGCSTTKVRTWPAGEWRHVAVTFDRAAQRKEFYIDGERVSANTTDLFPVSISSSAPLEFGVKAPGVYDEIMIWKRPLSGNEISRLAMLPEPVAHELAAGAKRAEPPPPEAAPFKNGLTFHSNFENGAVPDFSQESYVAKITGEGAVVDGVLGKGFRAKRIDFDARNVISPEAGSVSFWFRPAQEFVGRKETVPLFRAGHLNLALFSNDVNFMTGSVVDGKFRWDYSCSSRRPRGWKNDEWHHCVVTWDRAAGNKSIYIDGKLEKSSQTKVLPEAIQPKHEFFLGAGQFGSYDELAVWNRVLNPAEIARLTAYPRLLSDALGQSVPAAEPAVTSVQREARRLLTETAAPVKAVSFAVPELAPEATIIAPGKAFPTKTAITNHALEPVKGDLVLTLRDFWMNPVETETFPITLGAGETRVVPRDFTVARRGVYKVEARFVVGNEEKLCDVASFASWEQTRKPDPDSFFGNHVNSWAGGAYLRQAAKVGQNWMRNHNMLQVLWWEKVQPEPGAFQWKGDAVMKQLEELNMPVLGQLFTTPNWAAAAGAKEKSTGYNQCFKPDPAAFDRYVFETVSRYKNQVKYWEIWNEPDVSMFWKGTPEEFAETVQVAIKAIRRADPQAKVMAAGYPTVARVWHRRAAAAGAFKGLDIISFHYYSNPQEPLETIQKKVNAAINHFQKLAVEHGDGKKLPLWDSEGGAQSTSFLRGGDFPLLPPEEKREPMNWREVAIRVVQFDALLMSLGVEKNFMYLQNKVGRQTRDGYSNLSTLDVNNAPKPHMMSRVAMQEQLDYCTFAELVRKDELRFWAFVFQEKGDPNRSRMMTFCGPGGKLSLQSAALGKVLKKVDLMGNEVPLSGGTITVTEEPFYLHLAAPAAQVAKALRVAGITVEKMPEKYVEPEEVGLQHGVPLLPNFPAPAEAPNKVFALDLRGVATMGLADRVAGDGKGGWADEGDLNDMRDLKTGKRVFYGVPFELIDPATNHGRSVVTLRSRNLTPDFPEKTAPIPVGKALRNVYFLHAAAWGSPGVIGEYRVRYTDGKEEIIGMEIPRNCNNWWNTHDAAEESHPVPVRVTNTMSGKPAWRYLRVFEWQNPRPEAVVESITIASRSGHQTPIVLAISCMEK